jgi:hypothetical protein
VPTDYWSNKLFKLATITWQMTPFFAALAVIALARIKRDKNFWILSSWLVLGFLTVFVPYGQDAQRNFSPALAPVFIVAALYLEKIDLKNRLLIAATLAVIAVSLAFGLNDLMGYYAPAYMGIFYIMTLAALFSRQRNQILLAGFIGLSIYFAFSHASNQFILSDTVGGISEEIRMLGYNYTQVWASKDIAYYMTPMDRPSYVNHIGSLDMLTPAGLKSNNISYVAFYSTPNEDFINDASRSCREPRMFSSYGHVIGFVCQIENI